ncbi:LOW QUALITY PROTEIN: hypothetical protein LZ30DRAFT_746955 [Colletotrichum cereale]|nr:LOW QUALITY PROTEIN: hypothetical protein LZ30DRAFT_746955 [Colletotrichum cereale]
MKKGALKRSLRASSILCCIFAACAFGFGLQSFLTLLQPTIPLGSDQWGIVPQGEYRVAGLPTGCSLLIDSEPASWRSFYNDSRDPFWINEDTFDNLSDLKYVVRRLKWLQNCEYRDWDGKEGVLPSYRGPTSPTDLFGIRSFHQIHCIIVMVEDYGFRLHGETSQWTPGHFMHCLNTMRQLIQCMADASPISLVKGTERHPGDGQQMYCRDFDGLRRWANAPKRGVRYAIVSPPGDPSELSLYGSATPFKHGIPLPSANTPPRA